MRIGGPGLQGEADLRLGSGAADLARLDLLAQPQDVGAGVGEVDVDRIDLADVARAVVWLAVTRSPTFTAALPIRPEMGARMVV